MQQQISKHSMVLFDSNEFVMKLMNAGLNRGAAATMASILSAATEPTIHEITANSVTKADFQRAFATHNAEADKLRSEIHLRQSQAYQQSKLAMEQLLRELRMARQRARESLSNVRAESRLELSLERGKMRDMALAQTLKVQDLHTKVDTEIANADATLGKMRHDISGSLTGLLFTSSAALFSYLRLTM